MLIPYIEQKTEKLLKGFDLYNIPVNLLALGEYLGVNIQSISFDEDDISGLFVIKDKTPFIRYNANEGEARQRFTIAHELGHYLLHSNETFLFVDKTEKIMYRNSESSSGEQRREREANAFAASLLMPRSLVIEFASKLSEEFHSEIISKLSSIFNVSDQAMGIRLSNLGMLEFGHF